MRKYLIRHAQVLVSAVGQLAHAPGSTLLSTAAIGVTLALPSLLFLVLDNLHRASGEWEYRAPVSLFLKKDLEQAKVDSLAAELQQLPEVAAVKTVSAAQALEDFRAESGLGAALAALEGNPLPSSIILYLRPEAMQHADKLVENLSRKAEVDFAQSDVAWLERLLSLVRLAKRGVLVLTALLAFAVVVIISNTLRLAILSRREEIEIMKLVGGSDRFVRRPFLYSGCLQGILGAVFALVVITACLHALREPIAELSRLYGVELGLTGLRIDEAGLIVLAGAVLGWLASRWSVGRHLARIEPT